MKKIYKTQQEIESDIKDDILTINEDVQFDCSFKIDASLKVRGNIVALDIDAWNIDAWNIDARNIHAYNIRAYRINAENISFYALCFAYKSFKCKSITGRRENAKYGCLDSEVQIIGNTV